MSGVDVLAVLDDAARWANQLHRPSVHRVREARAAVAELLAATKAMLESGDEGAECGSRADLRWGLTKARAAEALARCKGEQA